MDRVDAGLKPACVSKCVTHCLHFGHPAAMVDARRERHAKAMAAVGWEVILRQPAPVQPQAKPRTRRGKTKPA
jgi:Fe-S-cluster-containing dehydrogenase component